MRYFSLVMLASIHLLASGIDANACITFAQMDSSDVKFADVVVVGKIRNYKIVEDPKVREIQKKRCENKKTADDRYCKMRSFLSDYAQFQIEVDTVLKGEPDESVSVTWDNSTFGEPISLGEENERFLIALRAANSNMPPLRGPSAFISANPSPELLTVLQAPCSSPFIFKFPGETASKVKDILDGKDPGDAGSTNPRSGLY
ncbi:MAG: hypothetical protein VYA18_13660 [Pseudomonadota bacterium]|nr:hypothetical protein [Pseudomonadota bacterium]